MNPSRPFRPSPAMVVALLALSVALGGAGYAAVTLPRNSVGTPQLRNGAVSAAKLKSGAVSAAKLANGAVGTRKLANGAVTGAKIQDGSIGGADILLASLGKVPSAASADKTAGVTIVPLTRATPTSAAGVAAARSAAPEIPLLTKGQLTIYGKCLKDTGGPAVAAESYVKTAADGAILSSQQDDLTGAGGNYLNVATPEVDRQLEVESAALDRAAFGAANNTDFSIVAPDGTALRGFLYVAAKQGTIVPTNGVYGVGDVCIFGGFVMG